MCAAHARAKGCVPCGGLTCGVGRECDQETRMPCSSTCVRIQNDRSKPHQGVKNRFRSSNAQPVLVWAKSSPFPNSSLLTLKNPRATYLVLKCAVHLHPPLCHCLPVCFSFSSSDLSSHICQRNVLCWLAATDRKSVV